MSMVNVRGVDFFYRESGQGAPIVLIHGAAGNADVWSSVFDLLARDHRARLISTRFGRITLGGGYLSSLEREGRPGSVQFSSVSPFTRPNSAVLLVTSLSPRLRA